MWQLNKRAQAQSSSDNRVEQSVCVCQHNILHYRLEFQISNSNKILLFKSQTFLCKTIHQDNKVGHATYVCCNLYYNLIEHLCYNFVGVSQHTLPVLIAPKVSQAVCDVGVYLNQGKTQQPYNTHIKSATCKPKVELSL